MKYLTAKLQLQLLRIRAAFRLKTRDSGPKAQFANIGEGSYEHGQKSYLPDASTTARYLLYKQGSDADHCVVAGSADVPLGPSDDQADTTNLVPIAINLLGAIRGTVRVTTDGTITNGSKVGMSGTTAGYAGAQTTGNLSFGIAVIPTDCSANAGDVIEIIPMAPMKYAF